MGGILGEILAPCQFGFIPGRRIHTCVALASDAINHLDAGTKGNMSLKVDILKDFNTSFFSMCYDVCNFPIVLYRWSEVYFPLPVSLCLLMVHHMDNFLVLEGSVRGNRSLPSFFFLAEEALARWLDYSHRTGFLSVHRGLPRYLFYADDILIFLEATQVNGRHIHSLLTDYGRLSGQVFSPTPNCRFPVVLYLMLDFGLMYVVILQFTRTLFHSLIWGFPFYWGS